MPPSPLRLLSLTAALALLPFAALAQDDATSKGSAEARLEAAAEAFEARMESYGERAEAIAEDEALTENERGTRMSALWAEYQPAVSTFTAIAAVEAGAIAKEALAEIDVEALVAEAMADVDLTGAMAAAGGIARNSAWVQDDPEQAVTYGLIAQYALDQAMDAVSEDVSDAAEEIASPEA